MPKAIAKDVAAETVSTDSLSFAGLICIEEKSYESPKVHASPPTKKGARRGKEDVDFEFISVIDKSIDDASNKNSLADVLFSNGHLVPHAIQLQSNEPGGLENVNSKQSSRPPRSSKKIAGGNKVGATESAKKTDTNKANKQHTTAGQWFGQKIIKSIATPCRDCRAVQPSPSMKEQSFQH
ncbi:hypothetical protein POM88_036845 [Heracleum sosnowskyi]|uniref:Uncharacterized protein n=1 Tax=Heracleum sosnowskyi TaxID=360622 RepID=A0AAD8HQT5_9APIA|nr:hypothetical protein POM88_036845 [Heracleum sosnowskyi]